MIRLLISTLLLVVACCGAAETKKKPFFPVALEQEFPDSENTFHEVMDLIMNDYYTEEITEDALFHAAIKGMLRHISPPKSPELGKLWRPADYDKVKNALKGVQVSLGVKSTFSQTEGSLTVTSVIPGSPSDGLLQPHDRIMRVNNEVLKGKPVSEIKTLLNGEVGTDVKLKIVRDVQVFDITITLKEFKTPNLTVSVLPNEIAFVEIHKITSGIADELKGELQTLYDNDVRKLILDLRNNTGGIFMESLRMAELFLPGKSILLRLQQRKGMEEVGGLSVEETKRYVSSNDVPFDFEIAIIVNGKTASSCEIVAGALRDHKMATIIGAATYGKSVVEKTYTLDNDYKCKFIIGVMYTPRGVAWQSKGILPDFSAPQDEKTYKTMSKQTTDVRLKKDVPLITAYKLLK